MERAREDQVNIEILNKNLNIFSFQVQNNAGGYVWRVSDENRIRRFLVLGTSGGTYYRTEQELTMANVADLIAIIEKGKGAMLLREIVDISLAGRAPKQEPTLFALALCAPYKVRLISNCLIALESSCNCTEYKVDQKKLMRVASDGECPAGLARSSAEQEATRIRVDAAEGPSTRCRRYS